MTCRQITLDSPGPIDRGKIFSILGYGRSNPPSDALYQRVDALWNAVPKRVEASLLSRRVLGYDRGLVRTEAGTIESANFGRVAREAQTVIFGIATATAAMDRFMENCSDAVDAMVADAMGSVIVEQGVDTLRQMLTDASGLNLSLPFSPGYCDYPLTAQETIFQAFGAPPPMGVQYHPASFMMMPVKTITFIMAESATDMETNPCVLCQLSTCQMRRFG